MLGHVWGRNEVPMSILHQLHMKPLGDLLQVKPRGIRKADSQAYGISANSSTDCLANLQHPFLSPGYLDAPAGRHSLLFLFGVRPLEPFANPPLCTRTSPPHDRRSVCIPL
jgi:hypothetical protein